MKDLITIIDGVILIVILLFSVWIVLSKSNIKSMNNCKKIRARPLTVVDVWKVVNMLEVIAVLLGIVFTEIKGNRLIALGVIHIYLQISILYQIYKKGNYLG